MRLVVWLLLLLPACVRAGFTTAADPAVDGAPPADQRGGGDHPFHPPDTVTLADAPADKAGTSDKQPVPCANDGAKCSSSGLNGICHGGSCCTGCWDTGSGKCRPGTTMDNCGARGGPCMACPNAVCTVGTCSAGQCVSKPVASGTPCVGGLCYGGSCCAGCWDVGGNACRPGTTKTQCGTKGQLCLSCASTEVCAAGVCQ